MARVTVKLTRKASRLLGIAITTYPLWYIHSMDWVELLITAAIVGGFIFIARSWGKGGDGGSCST